MWLYVPLVSAPESAGSTLHCVPTLEPSVTWRGKPMRQRSWSRAWKTSSWIQRLSGLTLKPSTLQHGVEQWISSLADIPASPSLWQVNAQEPTTRATFGLTCCECSREAEQLSLFSRTSEGTCPADCAKYSKTWPAQGSMRNGTCSARKRRARLTVASGSSYLPTRRVASGGGHKRAGNPYDMPTLDCMARKNLWPTPTVKGNHNKVGLSARSGDGLATAVNRAETFPTPCSRDHKDCGPNVNWAKVKAKHKLAGFAGGALNPTWVEWLMGWPLGWTDCALAVTESSQPQQGAPGLNSPGAQGRQGDLLKGS